MSSMIVKHWSKVGPVSVLCTVTMVAHFNCCFNKKKSTVGESTTRPNHSGLMGLLVQFHTQVLHTNAAAGILRRSDQL